MIGGGKYAEDRRVFQAVIADDQGAKDVPSCIVYYEERRPEKYSDNMSFIPASGAECRRLNPELQCAVPPYEFCEYLEPEYKERDVPVRHNEAVTAFGGENERIRFREVPAVKVISICRKGPCDSPGEAYAFIMKYAEQNGYRCAGLARECYIDGIRNRESPEDWLTEIRLPME